ncbi:MAG: EFR1 family ferrodoxin [Promethearchaeota archaeon]|jgi:NAD-dependent dihydropyrimidine dehydrogenase PreA subunit/flavodoxin
MKTTIYYFTGTGNSLKIARSICDKLEDCDLVPIAKVWQEENLTATSEKVGFIFPLYYSGLPKIVYDFVEKTDLSKSRYFFTIVVSAGGTTEFPFQQLERILKTKAKKLHLGYILVMPTNYIIAYEAFSEERQNLLFEKAIEQVEVISEMIKNEGNNLDPDILKREFLIFDGKYQTEKFNANFREKVNRRDESFYVEDTCTSCRICEEICPVSNIILVEGNPQWQHKCQLCLACINYCPEGSIQFGTESKKTQRYHHPEIRVQDIKAQKK